MKPAKFTYACPQSVDEALALLASGDEGVKILAGGQSLVPLLNLRMAEVSALLDVNRLTDLAFIRRENGILRVGALTRHRQLEASPEMQKSLPLVARAAGEVGHLAIRNRGTIGGSLVHADPAAEWPLVAVTLNAEFLLRSQSGSRTVKARDFFLAPLTTTIQPNELLGEIRFPVPPGSTAWGFQELCRRPGDFAIAAVACQLTLDASRVCTAAALAVGGAHDTALYIDVEKTLKGSRGEDHALRQAAEIVAAVVDPPSDVHGSADYRRQMVRVLTVRALKEAWGK
ncbi:MAG: xanthine dehydrogenase family protein subunit M [Deltaproteobacteria bacterium]|nr:xanthine dehydrogenase family protein subunit M [Deltaproteobacteria bacterium]